MNRKKTTCFMKKKRFSKSIKKDKNRVDDENQDIETSNRDKKTEKLENKDIMINQDLEILNTENKIKKLENKDIMINQDLEILNTENKIKKLENKDMLMVKKDKKDKKVDNKDTKILKSMNKYNEVKITNKFCILGRENEFKIVQNHLNSFIENGTSSSLYITGVPGSGKTYIVKMALYDLTSTNISVAYVNCAMIKRRTEIYSEISQNLGCKTKEKDLKGLRKHLITCNSHHVIVLDEIDFLYTKNEITLYNIFELPLVINGKILLIGISNTLGRLSPRLESRIGKQRLNFRPYSAKDLSAIVMFNRQICRERACKDEIPINRGNKNKKCNIEICNSNKQDEIDSNLNDKTGEIDINLNDKTGEIDSNLNDKIKCNPQNKINEETNKINEETNKINEETNKINEETNKINEETNKINEETYGDTRSVELVCKRVASATGDVRKVFEILGKSGNKSIKEVHSLMRETQVPLLNKFIKNMTYFQKLLIHLNKNGKKNMIEWFEAAVNHCKRSGREGIGYIQFKELVEDLEDFGIFVIKGLNVKCCFLEEEIDIAEEEINIAEGIDNSLKD